MFIALLAWQCNDSEPLTGDNRVKNIKPAGFIDYGCSGQTILPKSNSRCAYLENFTVANDTLKLIIMYEGNCCPGFTDSIKVLNGGVEIIKKDSLYDCRCICNYENEYSFLFEGSGKFSLSFITYSTEGNYYCSLDTAIIIP